MYKTKEPVGVALNGLTAAIVNNGGLMIVEAQQEIEGCGVSPAKSIWLNARYAERLRDFLNEQFPKKDGE